MERPATNRIEEEELRNILALTLIPGIGARRVRTLIHYSKNARSVFTQSPAGLMRIPDIGAQIAKVIVGFDRWQEVDAILNKTHHTGAGIITIYDAAYPERLRQLYDAPVLLWYKGDTELLSSNGIAVVGTRRPTAYGKKMTEMFTTGLVQNGLTVVSGLAYGVDTVAHDTCLKGGGKTIAVLGSGIDWIYPSSNKTLASNMTENGGVIISEFPPGTKPDASNFPERNRIVSGLSLGVLVIETGVKGGSMITARFALDQNREVFVVPHDLDNEHGIGCNALIKKGTGKLVQDMEDLLVEFPAIHLDQKEHTKPKPHWQDLELSDQATAICKILEDGDMHIDKMCEKLGKSSHELMGDLLELEMLDCIQQSAGKHFRIK